VSRDGVLKALIPSGKFRFLSQIVTRSSHLLKINPSQTDSLMKTEKKMRGRYLLVLLLLVACDDESSTGPGSSNELTIDLPGDVSMEFVWIEPGDFLMGSPESEIGRFGWEGPRHQVTISRGFWLGKYEITQTQWEGVMGTSPWVGENGVAVGPNHPAVHISWNDVQEFLQQLNKPAGEEIYGLPSEAEWEYACRAGTQTTWSFGDDEGLLKKYAWYLGSACKGGECAVRAVGTRTPNEWGGYDMHGNVWEWVQDWYSEFDAEPKLDPQGAAAGTGRVVKGGTYYSEAQYTRSAYRYRYSPGVRDEDLGARIKKIR
jgi:formylglycine-generating enzyme required for sulfatase activity